MIERLLEQGAAFLLDATEVHEDAAGLGDGEQGDNDGLELLGASPGLEGVEVAFGRARAGP